MINKDYDEVPYAEERSSFFGGPIVLDISTSQMKALANLLGGIVCRNVCPTFKLSDFKTPVRIEVSEDDPYKFRWLVPIK